MEVKTRNVNTAFKTLVEGIHNKTIPTIATTSRYGDVLQIPEPVLICYERPRERVLFNPARDCNHAFHLYEILAMLAGFNNVAALVYYNKRMAEFSDDGKRYNSFYGERWRRARLNLLPKDPDPDKGNWPRTLDQLKVIIEHLKAKPDSRRAVLQIWSVEEDLLRMDTTKDNACNTQVYFALRELTGEECFERNLPFQHDKPHRALDITVCNRSNDLVWGCLGANAVQFSVLLEYMAANIGVEVGTYYQFTNNLHVYTNNWQPEKWLADYNQGGTWSHEWYESEGIQMVPLVKDPVAFDEEVMTFVERHKDSNNMGTPFLSGGWSEPFLTTVAEPLCNAFHAHKVKDYPLAKRWADMIAADDWRIAVKGWLERRQNKKELT